MNHNPVTQNTINPTRQSWVHRNQLKLGMYVVELDKPWEKTPFLFQGFSLDTPELIEQVQDECEYVLVEQQKFAGVSRPSPMSLSVVEPGTVNTVRGGFTF